MRQSHLSAAVVSFFLLLVVTPAGAQTTRTWTGSVSATWSEPANWSPSGVPVSGDSLIFPVSSGSSDMNNDLTAGLTFQSITFSGSGYSLTGNALSIGSGGLLGSSSTLQTPRNAISAPVTFTTSQSLSAGPFSFSSVAIGSNNLTFSTPQFVSGLSGTGTITASFANILLSGTNTFAGTFSLATGNLLLSGGSAASASVLSVSGSNSVIGNGTVGNLNQRVWVAPGVNNSSTGTGIINTGSIANTVATYSFDIKGAAPGTGYDQLNVTGSIVLGTTNLAVSQGSSFVPTVGQQFVLINNDGADAVSGTFNGLAQGATVNAGGVIYQVSYTGGDGNDIVLTCTRTPKTWSGAVSDLWSVAANWSGGVPVAGDTLVFPTGGFADMTNDLPAGTTYESLTFEGAGYVLSGNAIVLSSGISGSAFCCLQVARNTIHAPITLTASQTLTAGPFLFSSLAIGSTTLSVSTHQFISGLSGTGTISASGANILLSGSNTFSGTFSLFGSNLLLGGSASAPAASVSASSAGSNVVIGNGTVGNLMNRVSVYPGQDNTNNGTGIINTGSISNTFATYWFDINGSAAGTGYDRINVTGTINLGSTTLSLSQGSSFVPTVGQQFVLINNDGNDAVSGTFSGLPQGTTITASGVGYQVSYTGGDGNDIVLTCNHAPKTWTGAVSELWSEPGNWQGGVPVNGDALVFPSGSLTSMTNDLPAGRSYESLTFSGSNYSLAGNSFSISGGISGASSVIQYPYDSISAPVELTASQTFSAGPIGFNGGLAIGAHTLTISKSQFFTGGLSGTGTIAASFANILLSGGNTFSGTFSLFGGNLLLGEAGTAPAATVTSSSGGNMMIGNGSIGNVVDRVWIFPGEDYSSNGAGVINTGSITNTFAQYGFDINGPTAGIGYDRLNVSGTISLGSTTLVITQGASYVPTIGDQFVLISNDGSDAIAGTFTGMAQGSTITVSGYHYSVSYTGGDGNDFVLTSLDGKQPTTTTLVSSANPSVVGNPVTFTATVGTTSGTATGTITFKDGKTTIASISLSGGAASFTTSSLIGGTHQISATYGGDAANGASTSNFVAQFVDTPPALTPIGNKSVFLGSTLGFTVIANDADGHTVTFSVMNLPTGASFDGTSGAFSWTPSAAQLGSYNNVTFTAHDGFGGTASEAITITVSVRPRSDFDGDGDADVVLRNYASGQNALWLMNGTALTGIVDLPALPNTNYRMEGTADFNANGQNDIVLRNYASGQNALWLLNGTTLSAIVDLPALLNADYHFEGTGDFNADNKPDIILRNYVTGQNALWLMNGTSLSAIVDLPALPNSAYKIESSADFNADGKTDIVLRNYTTGRNALWLMNGTALSAVVDLPALTNTAYRFDAVGDFNGDGKPDIVLRNYTTGQNAVWLMNGTALSSIMDLPALPNTAYEINGPR